MVCLLCDFKILLTVFNQSYNCQTSHYLGRNRLRKPFLILPSLGKTDPKGAFWLRACLMVLHMYFRYFINCFMMALFWLCINILKNVRLKHCLSKIVLPKTHFMGSFLQNHSLIASRYQKIDTCHVFTDSK